ncbi:diguanylate cyclase domain-containing protein [Cellvibrio sp.]|uniref:diguanylate cyclase domain-containing protein n=1 Tax=Cellvibrio sp. TaxID=1965322 RepID=UPI0039648C62
MNDQLLNVINLGVIVVNQQQKIVVWNKWIEQHSRLTNEEALNKHLGSLFGGLLDLRLSFAVNEAIHLGMASVLSHTLHPNPLPLYDYTGGEPVLIKQSVEITPFSSEFGEHHCLLLVRDVTDVVKREEYLRQQARQSKIDVQRLSLVQEHLRKNELRFRELTRHAPVGLFELDENGCWGFLNEKCSQILGLEEHELLNIHWTNAVPESENANAHKEWNHAKNGSHRFWLQFMYCKPDRKIIWLQMEGRAIKDEKEKVTGYIGTIQDITEHRDHIQKIEFRANYDSLTLVFNRNYFETKLRSSVAGAREVNQKLGFLFVDLNKFKEINDEYGHSAGDKVLKSVAAKMRRAVREGDVVARLGGDEFAIILNDIESELAIPTIVAKIRHAVSLPVNIGNIYLKAECAIGVSIFPQHGDTFEQLMNHADMEMYKDKSGKRS